LEKQKKSYTIDTVNETEMEQLMKFIHVSDVHLGIKPDEGKPWSEKRAQDIWDSFAEVIGAAVELKPDFLLISGDLFHAQPLKKELREVEEHRERLRTQRKRSNLKVAALVGYTSAGKSSLENALTGAGVLEDAMLFSTLDTTTRSLRLADTQEILLSDTVGFIRKLPHHLVEAFKSTLEEAKYADIIIHVVDASNPHQDTQMYVVYETLRQLGAEGKPVITVFNKQDKLEIAGYFRDFHAEYSIPVSAKTGQGLEELKEALLEILRRDQVYIERLYSFAEAGKIQLIRTQGQLLSEEYVPDGIEVKAYVPKEIWGKV